MCSRRVCSLVAAYLCSSRLAWLAVPKQPTPTMTLLGRQCAPSTTGRACRQSCAFKHSVSAPRSLRTCRAAAAAGSSGPQAEGLCGRAELAESLQIAVAAEDYAAAARIKRHLEAVDDADPILALKKRLQQAVQDESYQDAAQLKQELMELEQRLQPPAPAPQAQAEQTPCCSDTTTHGVRVQVQSQYVPQQSLPAMSRFFFTYRVTLINNSSNTVQLKTRHWVITDATGRVEHVRGPGVVGEEPVLAPGSVYSYQSACPLHTPHGHMAGEFMMSVLDSGREEMLEVTIAKFGLNVS